MNVLSFSENMQEYAGALIQLLASVYLFNLINLVVFKRIFNILGIHPRKMKGLPGIVCAPFLHGSTEHFLMNAVPFFFIALMMVAILDWDLTQVCIAAIAVVSGAFTWLVGRRGIHIGASGVVTGMFGWVAHWTIYSPTIVNIVILGILLVYFGSIAMGIFPDQPGVSWEGHMMGLMAGILCAKEPWIVDEMYQIQIIIMYYWGLLMVYLPIG